MKERILIVTPRSPFQGRGADEQDRLEGIKWFIKHGFDVRVIAMTMGGDVPHLERAKGELGIDIISVPYKFKGRKEVLKRLINPKYWDGAAFEYFDAEIQSKVRDQIEAFKPDFVWFDYTYLWPLYKLARRKGIPIISRSINFEALHFLDEDGRSPLNYLRSMPKFASEWLAFAMSDYFFSITVKEEMMYRKLWSTPVRTLPLRALPQRVVPRIEPVHGGVKLGFMPSTYTVEHNRSALMQIIRVAALLPQDVRQAVKIHVTGQKFPEDLRKLLPEEIVYDGFVPSSIEFWQSCDIALAPSVFGAGMQQKIFEPITLGVPTITSKRGLAGYSFACGREVVCAESDEEMAEAIKSLSKDKARRADISMKAQEQAKRYFSQSVIDSLISEALDKIRR